MNCTELILDAQEKLARFVHPFITPRSMLQQYIQAWCAAAAIKSRMPTI
jgi:hypothetical protein